MSKLKLIRYMYCCNEVKRAASRGLCHTCYERVRLRSLRKPDIKLCRGCNTEFDKKKNWQFYCTRECSAKNKINIGRSYRERTSLEQRRTYAREWNRKRGALPRGQSQYEVMVVKELEKLFDSAEIQRNVWGVISKPTHKLELDIYLPKRKLAIEVDGETHRYPVYGQERLQRQIDNDAFKDKEAKRLGINLVRVHVGKEIDTPLAQVPKDFFDKIVAAAREGGWKGEFWEQHYD